MKTMTSNMGTTTMDTTRTMKKGFNLGLAAFVAASIMLCSYEAWAGATQARNPPECDKNSEDCGCDNGEEVTPACIKVNLALGETTPWTRSMSCALKIFADSDSPNVFSQDSLYGRPWRIYVQAPWDEEPLRRRDAGRGRTGSSAGRANPFHFQGRRVYGPA